MSGSTLRKLQHLNDDPHGTKRLDSDDFGGKSWSVVAASACRYWSGIQNGFGRPWWCYDRFYGCAGCEGLSDLVFRFDDPIWRSLFPPNNSRCMCCVRCFTDADVEKRRFDEPALYDGREAVVCGRGNAENRGYRMHRLSAERRKVKPDADWLGRPVACEPAEVYRQSGYLFKGGGMIVPPDVSLPELGESLGTVGLRRLAALREDIDAGVAGFLLRALEGSTNIARDPGAILWAQAWGVDLDGGLALAAQSRRLPAGLDGAALAAEVRAAAGSAENLSSRYGLGLWLAGKRRR